METNATSQQMQEELDALKTQHSQLQRVLKLAFSLAEGDEPEKLLHLLSMQYFNMPFESIQAKFEAL